MFWQPLSVPSTHAILSPRIALLLWSFWLTNCPSCMLPLWWIRFTSCTTRSPILSPRKSSTIHTPLEFMHGTMYCKTSLCVFSRLCSLDFARLLRGFLSSLGSSMRPLVWSGHLCGSFVMVWSSEVWSAHLCGSFVMVWSAHLCGSFVMVWSAAWCPWYSAMSQSSTAQVPRAHLMSDERGESEYVNTITRVQA